MRIHLVSLGCPKNLVDGESMLGLLAAAGHEPAPAEAEADAVIINTCGFIRQAQRESIAAILDAARSRHGSRRPLLIVAGCLAQAAGSDIMGDIPEVDAVVGTGSVGDIAAVLKSVSSGERVCRSGGLPGYLPEIAPPRLLSTPGWTAYVKITEGCDNRCRYCVIPTLRGPHRSRPREAVLAEVEELLAGGVKEIILVGQDLTRYGEDLPASPGLPALLRSICRLPGILWVRLHYLHPAHMTSELLEVIAGEPAICKYLDLPMQHGDDRILASMQRGVDSGSMLALLERARSLMPGVAVRSSFIAGYPGESEVSFTRLLKFMRRAACDWAGVFAFSGQEGTPAASLPGQVPALTRIGRRARAMTLQRRISREANLRLVGRTLTVLVETPPREVKAEGLRVFTAVTGRSYRETPDVDGLVHVSVVPGNQAVPQPGSLVTARVTAASHYDLYAEIAPD